MGHSQQPELELTVQLLRTQAEIYEYLAGKGGDSDGIELAKRYSALQADLNQMLSSLEKPPFEFAIDTEAGKQLLDAIASRI